MTQDDYSEQLRRRFKSGRVEHRNYFYVVATHRGKRVLLGPYLTEEAANDVGFQKLDVAFQVFALPTKDRSRATQILKAQVLRETADLGESLERVRHKL